MHIFNTDPRRFRLGELVKMGHRVRHKLALQSVGSLSAARLTLGRYLLAIQETRDFKNFGCSSSTHYACAKLGIARREMLKCRGRTFTDLVRIVLGRAENVGELESDLG